jgi:hypothetical protein
MSVVIQTSLVRVTARAYVLLWVFWVYVYVLRVYD